MKSEPDLTLPGLAHDLNNVFQTLVDAAFRLSADPRWAEVSSSILRSVERGQRITQSLFEGGSSARLTSIFATARSFVEDSAGVAIQFECDIDPTLELREGWAWERVLINMFLNSCRVMPDGGTIRISGRREASGVVITVSDQGTGIPRDLLETLFDPHVSGSGSTGLGLHIVKTIVEQDGGRVQATNLARGAEFRIELPISAFVAISEVRAARVGG